MESQVTNNANALRLFFTEDVFLVKDKSVENVPVVTLEAVLPKLIVEVTKSKDVVSANKNDEIKNLEAITVPKNYQENAEIPLIAKEPEPAKTFKFLGGNKKSVLILVNDDANDVSSNQGRELLRKIVKAIDLNTPDFALINYANYHGTDFAELKQFFKPQLMLAFGVETNHLKLNFVWENEALFYEKTKMIFAPNLHDLEDNLAEKKALWAHLKKL